MNTLHQPLSAVAFRILQVAPLRFRQGNRYSTRQFAALTGYSRWQCARGLAELAEKGYCQTFAYARDGRVMYGGRADVLLAPSFSPQMVRRTRTPRRKIA